MAGKLTPKQAAFVAEYLIDLNATQAAIRAGYSEKTAGSQGERLLKKVEIQIALAEAQQKRAERTEITADNILQEIAKVAFSDVRRIFDANGGLIRISDLDDNAAACIAGCELVTNSKGEGEIEHVAKLKLADKLKALELAGRHLGMFNDKLNLSGDIHVLNVHRKAKRPAAEEGES
jgi:phage terminase small subunit